jgi:hypothetical protein
MVQFPDVNCPESFVSDVAHACAVGYAVGYYAAPLVAVMRADALRQWGSARSRFKRTVGVRSQFTGNIAKRGLLLSRGHRADLATTRPKRFELWPGSRATIF